MNRLIRILISSGIFIIVLLGLIFIPIITLFIFFYILAMFIFTTFPYWLIASIYLKIKKARYVCITHPFKNMFLTVSSNKDKNITISDKIKKHEEDHIKYFNEGNKFIQCLKYIAYTIWYGYYDNPVEIRARKASGEK